MYKSLIRVLPQIGHVPLPRDGIRQSALPRLFLDIKSPPLLLDILSYEQGNRKVRGMKLRNSIAIVVKIKAKNALKKQRIT
jgi:hypothetical protein